MVVRGPCLLERIQRNGKNDNDCQSSVSDSDNYSRCRPCKSNPAMTETGMQGQISGSDIMTPAHQ